MKLFRKRKAVKNIKDEATLEAIIEKNTGHKLKVQQETPEQWMKRHIGKVEH